MNLFYSDFDKRFLAALTNAPDSIAPAAANRMTDAQVLRAMAKAWVASGGDAGGLTDEYVMKLRAEAGENYANAELPEGRQGEELNMTGFELASNPRLCGK